MQKGIRITIVFIAICLGLNLIPTAVQSRIASIHIIDDNTPVVVAEDKTIESDCRISIDNGPNRPCAPGSVVWTRRTTYAEVKRNSITNYFILGRKSESNHFLEEQIANQVSSNAYHQRTHFSITSCAAQNDRVINQSYTFSTGWRVYFTLVYDSDSSCNVSDVRNRNKTDGTTGISWYMTCTDDESRYDRRCNYHNAPLNSNWTPYLSEKSSMIQRKYRNHSLTTLHAAFGYFYFD